MMKSKINKKSKEKSDIENSDKPIIDLNNAEIKSLLKKGKNFNASYRAFLNELACTVWQLIRIGYKL